MLVAILYRLPIHVLTVHFVHGCYPRACILTFTFYDTIEDGFNLFIQDMYSFELPSHTHTHALLLYDGIHYDPLVIMDKEGNILQTTFPVSNDAVICEALDIASEAHKVQ